MFDVNIVPDSPSSDAQVAFVLLKLTALMSDDAVATALCR